DDERHPVLKGYAVQGVFLNQILQVRVHANGLFAISAQMVQNFLVARVKSAYTKHFVWPKISDPIRARARARTPIRGRPKRIVRPSASNIAISSLRITMLYGSSAKGRTCKLHRPRQLSPAGLRRSELVSWMPPPI